MNLQDQVASLELCKKLKELGVKYRSCFEWLKAPHIDYDAWHAVPLMPNQAQHLGYPAYSVAELGKILPSNHPPLRYWINKINATNHDPLWQVEFLFNNNSLAIITDTTEANLRAQMLIYLLEEGLIKNEQIPS